MDGATIAALTVAISALIVSIGGQIVAIITALNTGNKLDKVNETAGVIEKNTNSKLSQQDKEISELREEVKTLTAQIAVNEQVRAVKEAGEAKPDTLTHIIHSTDM